MDSPLLDCALGLVFLYATLSLFCTAISEAVSRWSGWRQDSLRKQLTGVLRSQSEHLESITKHPLVSVEPDQWASMVEVPSRGFVQAMVCVLSKSTPATAKQLNDAVKKIPDEQLKQALLTTIASTDDGKNMESSIDAMTAWFDSVMVQGTNEYRGRMTKATWVIAIVIVLALNIDTFRFLSILWNDQPLRQAIAAAAVEASDARTFAADAISTDSDEATLLKAQKLQTLAADLYRVPLGWPQEFKEWKAEKEADARQPESDCKTGCSGLGWLLAKIAGCAMTCYAITLGAPFWFDLLARLASMKKAATARVATRTGGKAT